MNIEFKKDAICYADGKQWFLSHEKDHLQGGDLLAHYDYVIDFDDFQLNKPLIGDYLPKSELETEQKYNDAVEVFGLFGFELNKESLGFKGLDGTAIKGLAISKFSGALNSIDNGFCKRKLTYNQLMAIGKLKRLMNKRTSSEVSKVNLAIERAVKSTINTELDKPVKISANKYEREISDRQGNSATVDVYDVLKAFEVTCPATQHAVKKLLCSGIRGHKDLSTDLIEAKESIVRAIELNG